MAHSFADEIQPFVADSVRIARLMDAALAHVEALHDRGEVHAGLHPRNFLVDDADQVLLDNRSLPLDEYAAPEAELTRASNIYSMGMILRGLRGNQPEGERVAELIACATNASPAARFSSIRTMRDEVSRMRGLHTTRGGRWLRAFTPADARERELLAACSDPETRAVYADWLEVHGFETRAKFLRVDAPGPIDEAPWRALVARSPVIGCATSCPQAWDRLERLAVDNIRRCPACQRTVFYCATIESARVMAYSPIALDVTIDKHAVMASQLARQRYESQRDGRQGSYTGGGQRDGNVLTRLWSLFRRR